MRSFSRLTRAAALWSYLMIAMAFGPIAPRLMAADPEVVVESWDWTTDARVLDDGSIWAVVDGMGLVRFDGAAWQQMGEQFEILAAGRSGTVVATNGETYRLFEGKQRIAERGTLKALLQHERARVVRAFQRPPIPEVMERPAFAIVADRDANLWVRDGNRLLVLVGDEWVDARGALEDAVGASEIDELAAIGGAKVYAASYYRRARFPLLGQIRGGRLHFEKIQLAVDTFADENQTILPDGHGNLWIGCMTGRPLASGGFEISGNALVRVGERETVELCRGSGWPVAIDSPGNLWFREPWDEPPGQLNCWRDGKSQTLHLADSGAINGVFCDRLGSVYVLASEALYHLTANAPRWDRFRLDATWHLQNLPNQVFYAAYSKLGFIALWGEGPGRTVFRIVLPR
ncbi:MAG TPA: hypothetical protein VGG64_07490 [Pirellulales bacterium]